MKKATAISFLALLLTCQYGHYLLFSVQEWQIRKSWEQKLLSSIPEAFLERFEDNANLQWEEKGREFYHDGNMYDVVRTRIENGRTIHFAVNDLEEGQIIKAFSRYMKDGPENTDLPKGGKSILKFQTSVFTLPMNDEDLFSMPHGIIHAMETSAKLITHPRSVIPCPPWA